MCISVWIIYIVLTNLSRNVNFNLLLSVFHTDKTSSTSIATISVQIGWFETLQIEKSNSTFAQTLLLSHIISSFITCVFCLFFFFFLNFHWSCPNLVFGHYRRFVSSAQLVKLIITFSRKPPKKKQRKNQINPRKSL